VSDQQAPAEPTASDQEENEDQILEAFHRKSSFGASQFLFEYWPAWMFSSKRKAIAPLCRIIIGDENDGSVLLDRPVLITGLLHLAQSLASSVAFNIQRASELPGVAMDVPGGVSHVLEIIDDLEGQLRDIRKMVEKKDLFLPDDDEEREL
jgi:hypothetical protein